MFCDGGPQPMPVDQTGENILFVWDGDTIEAHIQIQYTRRAAEVRLGDAAAERADGVLGRLASRCSTTCSPATVPTYGYTVQRSTTARSDRTPTTVPAR